VNFSGLTWTKALSGVELGGRGDLGVEADREALIGVPQGWAVFTSTLRRRAQLWLVTEDEREVEGH
jgi:hypothetical protein